MCVWKQGGAVLKKMGGREHVGLPRAKISSDPKDLGRVALAKRLMRKREKKTVAGKKTYQPTPKRFH